MYKDHHDISHLQLGLWSRLLLFLDLIPQHSPQDLARHGLWNLLEESNSSAQLLRGCDSAAQPFDNVRCQFVIRINARAGNYVGSRDFGLLGLIPHTNDTHVGNILSTNQFCFQLGGSNLEAL